MIKVQGVKCILTEIRLMIMVRFVAYEYVTCGSALKLLNTGHNVRLHSHDVKYGSGSGQQVKNCSRTS